MTEVRMPARIKTLKIDPVWKLPVPWFVQWIDGKPCFPVMDGKKWAKAVKLKLCWICGQPMNEKAMAFVIGPMCGINRTSAEPSCDVNCALYAAQTCPFLITPRMKRMDVSDVGAVEPAGVAIKRNPGCCAVWVTRSYDLFDAGNGPLIKLGEPTIVHWFACGRKATRAEVLESIESGLPILQNMAREEGPHAEVALVQAINTLERWLPK